MRTTFNYVFVRDRLANVPHYVLLKLVMGEITSGVDAVAI